MALHLAAVPERPADLLWKSGREERTMADSAGGLVIDFLGGNCPVQGEGFVDGKEFYFRARGERWSMSIGGTDVVMNPEWYYEQDFGEAPFDAGWMEEAEARGFIDQAVALYREAMPDHGRP
jgi:hypothetical protein